MALNWQGVWTVVTGLEFWGTLTGVWAVYLTARERMLNWPIGLINIGIFIALFLQAKLYSDVLLNVAFFLPLQIMGWIWWARSRRSLGLAEPPKPTRRITRTELMAAIPLGVAGGLALGWFMATYTDAYLPYADAMTTAFSIVAQFFLARRVLEHWFFWISVDIADIAIYGSKGLFQVAGLYAIFLLICVDGLLQWRAGLDQAEPKAGGSALQRWALAGGVVAILWPVAGTLLGWM